MRALFSLMAFLMQTPEIEVRQIQTTPTQAVLTFEAPDTASCVVRIFTDQSMAHPVHDTNEALFAGSQNCNRAGSLIEGNQVTFVAGLRRAQRAVDGRFYSRALAAYRTYYFQIESGSRTKLGSFQTQNIPLGKLYGEPHPFDADAPGRYAWPSIDWTDASKEYVDPVTGAVLKRATGPQLAYPNTTRAADGLAAFDTADGVWTNAENGAASDSRAATYSGTSREPLFVRAPVLCPDGFGCDRAARWDIPYRALDDVEVTINAWCSSSGCRGNDNGERNAEICLTANGVSCSSPWKTITVGSSSGQDPIVFPRDFPAPLLAGWLSNNSTAALPRPDAATHTGKVHVNGTEVIWASGHTFNVGAWRTGSRIRIGDSEHVIERVNGATSLTLSSDAGSHRDLPYTANNFGLLIRKATSSADVLEVDGVAFRIATSHEFEMPATGAWDFCSPSKVTDPSGKEGFLCRVSTAGSYPTLWFVAPSDGESRFLGLIAAPYNNDLSGGAIDGNEGACLAGVALGREDANEIYCITRSNARPSQGLLIFRGRYLPEGRAGCNQPAGYQAIPGGEACNIQWELVTKPSAGGALTSKAKAFNPAFEPERYPFMGLFAAQGGALAFYAWAGQDTMAWSIWLDTATFEVRSMQNYHSNLPCRFCAVHSFLQMGDDTYNAVVVKDLVGGSTNNAGPYEVNVTAVAGSSDTSLDTANFQACPADLPEQFKQAGATGVRCVTLTLSGDPCDPTPSNWERANRPACAWQPGAVTLQPLEVGDEAADANERFLFVRKLPANQWVVLRNYNIPHGPSLKERTSTTAAHRPGWKLRMACGSATDSGYTWVNYSADKHGVAMLRDNGLARAEHGDVTTLGNVMAAYDSTTDRFGRFFWNSPIPQRVSTPADAKVLIGRTFGGLNVHTFPAFRDFIQTHPSWRQITAPESERKWFLDGNPFAPQSGSNYTLWKQPSENISGPLYKLGGLASPLSRKFLPTIAWSGRNLLEEISGPGSRLTAEPGDHWKYCVADKEGECVEGSRPGDVYLNVPSMTSDGNCGNLFFFQRPCFTSMVNLGIGINQYGASEGGQISPDRFLTGHFQRYNATWTYSNAAPLPDGSWALVSGSWLEGARSDLLLVKLPPYPQADSIDRGHYVPVKVNVAAATGATRARLRFGYSENGPPDRYYCTSRKESCVTGGEPFAWAGESHTLEGCPNGCIVEIPAISGRVVYYTVDWLDDAHNIVRTGGRGAVAVP